MFDEISIKTKEKLPLEISSVKLEGEQLVLEGDSWSLVLATSWWRLVKNGLFLLGCTQEDAHRINEITGLTIVNITNQSLNTNFDLTLVLSNGVMLESFSTSSLEPWSITFDDTTYYSDPSDEKWIGKST